MSEQQQPAPLTPTSPQSEVGSTYASPHRRRGQTRREALDRILKHGPRSARQHHYSVTPTTTPAEESNTNNDTATTIQSRGSAPQIPHDPHDNTDSELSRKFLKSMGIHMDDNTKSNNDGIEGTTVTTANSSVSNVHPAGYSALSDDQSDKTPIKQVIDNVGDASRQNNTPKRAPQHLLTTHPEEESDARYYRITYQGVVALLSEPHRNSLKSGAYVSYGEIIKSRHEINVGDEDSTLEDSCLSAGISPRGSDLYTPVESPPQSVLSHNAGSVSSLDTLRTASTAPPSQITQAKSQVTVVTKKLVRVDKVLTGGYALDASDTAHLPEAPMLAPKHSNLVYLPMVGPSPLPLLSDSSTNSFLKDDSSGTTCPTDTTHYGYLYTRKKHVTIAEPLSAPPSLQSGTFFFQIISSAPLPILTGPCVDAPRTKAILLPGTVHEVCLKMTTEEYDVCFLRLSHRRGWITDRRVTALGGLIKIGAVPAVKEVTDAIGDADDVTVSAISLASASITSAGSSMRRRHRPPRRKREQAATTEKSGLPRHVGGQTTPVKGGSSPLMTPQKSASPGRGFLNDKIPTPSSNISIMSDDESFELGSSYRFPTGLTPDRSVTTAIRKQSQHPMEPTFFLMQVNAPRGLKILDAPHFQVSNLIHGKTDANAPVSSQQSGAAPTTSKGSIFQTMSTHHTTKVKRANQIGNPAIFDSITKTRLLPRGVLFEASKRMEASGSFSRGAGLVKLSDNSGWAIIPRQEELNAQYRNYHGGAASIREGEASRAFEEVGNAVVDPEDSMEKPSNPSIWVHVLAKNGVPVACPPPAVPVAKDDEASPTSSAGNSSNVSGGASNYGVLSGPDSDVASSVGSAFLDAMFRTPKKRSHQTRENRTMYETVGQRRYHHPAAGELQDVPNILPCGSCVEVDRWEDTEGDDGPGSMHRSQDYVRLRGGQGWIPLNQAGMTVSVVIPKPDIRLGSFWFRVTSRRGIKVRLGPSRKAGSIKSDDGVYFRFECGEFLRASEVLTIFRNHDEPSECYAKLYRNRHVRLNGDGSEVRQLLSLTTPAEWVQVFSDDRLFLEECGAEPEILRHREGWRYNVVSDAGVTVRRGPSLNAEEMGVRLLVGESVVVTERVTAPGFDTAWLRLKDGEGWVSETDSRGRPAMIAHSLRYRIRPQKAPRPGHDDIAYNSIVARLFHDSVPGSGPPDMSAARTQSLDDDELRKRRQMH